MTTEVAILNREAVALAADSAVTVRIEGKTKILPSANKIFTLSKYQPVGVMVYGSAIFMELPWESIIKIYREQLKQKKFDYIEDYCKDFISWLTDNDELFPIRIQDKYVENKIEGIYNLIRREILAEIKELIESKRNILEDDVMIITSNVIRSYYNIYKEADKSLIEKKENLDEFESRYKKDIVRIKKNIFESLPITSTLSRMLTYIANYSLFRVPEDIITSYSGIVIAGFGEKEIYPSIYSIYIEGVVVDKLKHIISGNKGVTYENEACVLGFAQGDMVYTFMEGIDKDYYDYLKSQIKNMLDKYSESIVDIISDNEKEKIKIKNVIKKQVNKLYKCEFEEIENMRRNKFVEPVINTLSIMPKSELSPIAESLVHLTSLKRKMSFDDENVGGPIDVAVISKGDGFIWIKRKYYFDAELNYSFFNNYYKNMEVDYDEKE